MGMLGPSGVESGNAKIEIELKDGQITVVHGYTGVVLAVMDRAYAGSWTDLWAMLDRLGLKRVPYKETEDATEEHGV